jgi:hypothetical protein
MSSACRKPQLLAGSPSSTGSSSARQNLPGCAGQLLLPQQQCSNVFKRHNHGNIAAASAASIRQAHTFHSQNLNAV